MTKEIQDTRNEALSESKASEKLSGPAISSIMGHQEYVQKVEQEMEAARQARENKLNPRSEPVDDWPHLPKNLNEDNITEAREAYEKEAKRLAEEDAAKLDDKFRPGTQ